MTKAYMPKNVFYDKRLLKFIKDIIDNNPNAGEEEIENIADRIIPEDLATYVVCRELDQVIKETCDEMGIPTDANQER